MPSWRAGAYRTVRPLLFTADPEAVHDLALRGLSLAGHRAVGRTLCAIASGVHGADRPPVEVFGLRFRNPVGLAAGFDKDGVAIRGWAALGFGFVELGTVTPRPQPGHPKPRLFRLPHDEALINRMGFNNAGADALARRIDAARRDVPPSFVIGVNIGLNRDGDVDDYPAAAVAVRSVADYLAINVSSPNTPGLRGLQAPEQLAGIIDAVSRAAPDLPIVVKLSPDLSDDERSTLLTRLGGSGVAGLVVSNTTITRPRVRSRRLAAEAGGLSGRPLLPMTSRTVAQVARRGIPVIASGGIGRAEEAAELLRAGAKLVQLWTGLIYRGPGLIGEVADACYDGPV